MVRLKHVIQLINAYKIADFNPTMVRLKRVITENEAQLAQIFQSHNGSIKTQVRIKAVADLI